MNIAEIKTNDIANGEGVRTSVFVSGCRHHCPDCFNEIAWAFDYGKEWNQETEEYILSSCAPPWIAGLSLLGGEPFDPDNQRALLPLLHRVRNKMPQKTVWAFSGYTFEELTGKTESRARCEVTDEMLSLIDVLVDGEFQLDKRNISLQFRGSENQRLIDLPKTFQSGEIVWWQDTTK